MILFVLLPLLRRPASAAAPISHFSAERRKEEAVIKEGRGRLESGVGWSGGSPSGQSDGQLMLGEATPTRVKVKSQFDR